MINCEWLQDPLADGPVIQSAASRALSKGSTLDSVLDMLSSVTPDMSAPVVLFSYYNIIAARGLDLFCKQVKDAGVSGRICLMIFMHFCFRNQ